MEAQWPIGYGVGLRIKRSSARIRPWPLRWVLGQGSLLPLSQGEAFTLASISYLAILVKYILAKKKKKKCLDPSETFCQKLLFFLLLSSMPKVVTWTSQRCGSTLYLSVDAEISCANGCCSSKVCNWKFNCPYHPHDFGGSPPQCQGDLQKFYDMISSSALVLFDGEGSSGNTRAQFLQKQAFLMRVQDALFDQSGDRWD